LKDTDLNVFAFKYIKGVSFGQIGATLVIWVASIHNLIRREKV